MNDFHEQLQTIAAGLSRAAKEVVEQVIQAEHKRRFSDSRDDLPETFATSALKAARNGESDK